MIIDWTIPLKHYDWYIDGILTSLELTAVSLILGMVIALPTGIWRAFHDDKLARFIGGYIYVFRGTPLLVQTYLIYYGLAQFDAVRDSVAWVILSEAYWCAIIAFSLNTGAYTSEIVRVAIKSTPAGEVEAARAIGFSNAQIWLKIILPSAFRRMIPHYSNEVVLMLHGSVVASVITIQDILGVGRRINAKYYVAYEGFISAGLLYLLLTFTILGIFKLLEKRYMRYLVR